MNQLGMDKQNGMIPWQQFMDEVTRVCKVLEAIPEYQAFVLTIIQNRVPSRHKTHSEAMADFQPQLLKLILSGQIPPEEVSILMTYLLEKAISNRPPSGEN